MDKKEYETPAIVFETDLEVRAGSPSPCTLPKCDDPSLDLFKK